MKRAIVTVYYPDYENAKNIELIAKQVDQVIVCDNSPQNNQSLFTGDKIEYVFFGENLGLSAAFNQVLKRDFKWLKNDYIIFFDQDSTISDNHIDKLIAVYERLQQEGINVGCLGPVFYNNSNGMIEVPKMKTTIFEKNYSVQSIITSSMLITYGNLEKVDFWNEKIFLDMADWDLCWRLISVGMKCCMTEEVILNHTLGNGEKKIGIFRLRVGSTIRDYYQTRDCLYLLHEKYTPFKYKCRFIGMLTIRALMRLLFLKDKKRRFRYILRGMQDYFKKVEGVYKG